MATKTPTLRAQVAQLTALVESLVAAQAPATVAPAKAKAEDGFVTFLRAKQVANTGIVPDGFIACELHDAAECNRSFAEGSRGRQSHVARIGTASK